MEKTEEKKVEIAYSKVVEITKKFLNKTSLLSRRGSRIFYMNATAHAGYEVFTGLEQGKMTKNNIIALISREVARHYGIEPRKDKKKYNKIKLEIRSQIIRTMENNAEIKKRLKKILVERKFTIAEKIGNSKKIGPVLGKTASWIKHKRNLSVK